MEIKEILRNITNPDIQENNRIDLVNQAKHLQGNWVFEKQIQPLLHQCLDSKITIVRLLPLEHFKQYCTNPEGILFLKENGYVPKIVSFLLDPVIQVSECATSILVNFASVSPLGTTILFEEGLINSLKNQALTLHTQGKMTALFRILNMFALVATQSPHTFTLCNQAGCLQLITEMLQVDDLLEMLNVLELVEMLCSKLHGVEYLLTSGLANKFLSILEGKIEDDTGGLITEKIIQMFGNIIRKGDDVAALVLKLPLVEVLSTKLGTQFETSTITTLGAIGRSSLGTHLLSQNLSLVEAIGSSLQSPVQEEKLCVLNAFTEIFLNRGSVSLEDMNNLHTIFIQLSPEPPTTEIIMEFMKKPFFELRRASYGLLLGLSQYTWGIRCIAETPGLFELLLNRIIESEMEGFSLKFAIIQKIIENNESKTILGVQRYYDGLQYLKCGILYVATQAVPIVKDEVW